MVMHARDTFTGAYGNAQGGLEVDCEALVKPRKLLRLTMKPLVLPKGPLGINYEAMVMLRRLLRLTTKS